MQYIIILFINNVYVGIKGSQQVYVYQGGFQFRAQGFNKAINQYGVVLACFPYIIVKFREVYQETFRSLSYIVYLPLSSSLAVRVTIYSFKKYNQALYRVQLERFNKVSYLSTQLTQGVTELVSFSQVIISITSQLISKLAQEELELLLFTSKYQGVQQLFRLLRYSSRLRVSNYYRFRAYVPRVYLQGQCLVLRSQRRQLKGTDFFLEVLNQLLVSYFLFSLSLI